MRATSIPAFLAPLSVLTAALILAGCSSRAEVPDPVRPAIVTHAQTAAGDTGTLYTGDVHARYESALGFRVSGKIKQRHVDVGAHVNAGDLIADLDPQDLNLQAGSARASLAAANADLATAKAERDRYQALLDKHFVSATQFDAAENKFKAASARATEARATVSVAQNQAGYTGLRADHAGVITTITAEAGQVVAAGQSIATLARDGEREVEINVPENRIADYQAQQSAIVEMWAESGKRVAGSLREISPEADPTTRTYRVRVALDPAATVKLGQTARVFFVSDGNQDSHMVPLSALYEKDGKPAVWLLDPKTHQVHLRAVTVSAYREHGVLVSDGVAVQDWIIAAGVHKLREGQAINPVDASNRAITL